MFTGIIEALGKVEAVVAAGANTTFWISSPLSHELKVDQSLAHNGVCLTVEEVSAGSHKVTAIDETLQKTNLSSWKKDTRVNLERSITMNKRMDGHIVQGHVDATAVCVKKKDADGSTVFRFKFPKKFASLVIEKGSISLNGISLTVFDVTKAKFSVAIIPYTAAHTNMQYLKKGDVVNVEFDMIGKYVLRAMGNRK